MANLDAAQPERPRANEAALAVLECPAGKWWICALLGVVLLVAGVFVLFHAVLASLVVATFFAAGMIVGGAIMHYLTD